MLKQVIAILLFFIFFQKMTFCQTILTQTTFSSTYNDEKIVLQNYSYRINFLLTNSSSNSSNQIFPGILQPEDLNVAIEETPYALYSPNAFSPDGDGINDLFKVSGQGMSDFQIEIYNRWGQMVYKSIDLSNGWDGTFKGKNMPTGTYVYKIKTSNYVDEQKLVKSGTVALVR